MTAAVVADSLACTVGGAPQEPALVEGSEEWALHVPARQIDDKDKDTADGWVPRDPRVIRLTGRHPLNCEPPMEVLMQGFITPPSVHYVRNHGAVPKLSWHTHRIEVNGLVEQPLLLSMDELLKLPSITIPVTLVCAGNRRKEENMLKKSIGFNWGPCASSTSYWTGVRLGDVLRLAGVRPFVGAQYVCFRGPKGELPKGDDGSYGTSMRLAYALNDANDVLVAFKQNHRWLTPDHGFPVRMIIPGWIGGRMVKWLSEITVTSEASTNYYHFFDNRVLPSHIDEALATKEGHWYNPDYIIHDLNINSTIARPDHDEVVLLGRDAPYQMTGYAYSGGGRKVIRVEVSLDGGTSWKLAEIQRFEEPNQHGKHWCWVHWRLEVMTSHLAAAKELLLRAWDEGMNTQPAVITWNVMGMMNNCHFRVLVHPHVDEQGNLGLRFQHPAPIYPGALGNVGWREEEKAVRDAIAAAKAPPEPVKAVATSASTSGKTFTMAEVEAHTDETSAWFVHEGRVYDATPFLEEHPGGADSILISTGMDATEEFNSIHSSKAKAMLADYYIGDLVEEGAAAAAPAEPGTSGRSTEPPAANGHANGAVNGHVNGVAVAVNGAAMAVNGKGGLANGTVKASSAAAATVIAITATSGSSAEHPVALDPRKKVPFTLVEKAELSPNVRRFRFALPSPQHKLGLPVGKHVFLYASIGGENVMRAYTPTSSDQQLGHVDLVVKVYRRNEHPQFPEGGKMSQHLDSMRIGDTLDFKGPVGHMVYEGRGRYTLNRKPQQASAINMVAGGTGITPCWQVLRAVLDDPADETQVRLVYANRCEEDILLREELDQYANNHPGRFRIWYTLSAPPADWAYSTGHVDEQMLRKHLLPAATGTITCLCGPPGMIELACLPSLASMGFAADQIIQF